MSVFPQKQIFYSKGHLKVKVKFKVINEPENCERFRTIFGLPIGRTMVDRVTCKYVYGRESNEDYTGIF